MNEDAGKRQDGHEGIPTPPDPSRRRETSFETLTRALGPNTRPSTIAW